MAIQPFAPPPTAVVSPDAQVRAQLIALLYATRRTVYANLAIGLTTAFLLLKKVPLSWLAGWIALLVLLFIARLMLAGRYDRERPPVEAAPRWGRYYAIGLAATGLFWGISALYVFAVMPPDPVLSVYIVMLFAGFTAGAAWTLAPYLPAFYAYTAPMLLSLLLGVVLRADEFHITLVVLIVVFILVTFAITHKTHKMLSDSIALRFENINLIQELKSANIAKSKFLAAASHDLRQPLHALTLFVSALKKTRYPEVRKIVDNMNVSLQALDKLFAALLDISRLDAGVIQPQACDFRLQALFEQLKNDCALEAEQKGLTFSCPATDLIARSDPQLLERILRNYLSNAIRYTGRGEIALRCEVLAGSVRIEVADTGKGIPRDKQQEIFREFHQLENPERDRTKGLGLGLAIVDRLAKLLDHPIAVRSEPGRGAVFSIDVPLGDARTAVRPQSETPDPDVLDLSGLAVLVIDDEMDVRVGMKTLLEQWGCEALLAGSEEEAIALLRQTQCVPDAVIADYRLRENRTGVEAIRRIQDEYGAVPALIITGDTAPDRLREAAASGHRLLHKPVSPGQLSAFLENARGGRG